jgi:hypothetical protein
MYKKSVLFYTQNRWAFGQIHHALIKRLWSFGYYCHLLDWTVAYSDLEWQFFKLKFNIFVTTPEAVHSLLHRGVPPERIVTVAHAEKDIVGGVNSGGVQMFDNLLSFGVVNKDLVEASKKLGINRVPDVVRVGIDFDHYYLPRSNNLTYLGYAGELKHITAEQKDCKRAYLVGEVIKKSNIPFRQHQFFNHLAMAGYYSAIDAIICPSNSETAGLPNMEAAAAGRLVMSTPVGYFDGSYGVLLSMDEQKLIDEAVAVLEKYKDPALYAEACDKTQQYSRDHHDWCHHIEGWVNLLN